jgi:hypothetical protein
MRFIALGVILVSLPLFVAWLQSAKKNRDLAMTLLGALVFAGGSLQLDASIIAWPMWAGTSRGFILSPVDTLALALLFTRRYSGKWLPMTGLMAAYLAVVFLSATHSRVFMASMFSVWDFSRAFLVFLALGGELARPTAYSALLRGFSLGLVVQAGYVIDEKLSGVVQASGTMAHQNLLGMATELVFLNLLAAVLEGERSRLVMLGILAGAIIAAGGGSRATLGLLGAASVVLIVLSLIRRSTPSKVTMAAAAGGLLLAAVPLAMLTLDERFGGLEVTTQETQRDAMELAASNMSRDYPFGIGANLYTTVANSEGYSQRAGVSWGGGNLAVPVHNAYLLARAELGYLGQAMFMLLLLMPVAFGLTHAFRNRRLRADGWTLGPAVALSALAVHSAYEFNAMVYTVQLPLAMNIAIVAGRIRASRMERARAGQRTHQKAPEAGAGRARSEPGVPRLPEVPKIHVVGQRQGKSADDSLPVRSSQEARN